MLFNAGLILCLTCNRQYTEAIQCAHAALAIDQSFHVIWSSLGIAQLCAGLAAAYHASGNPARGKELAAQFTSLNFGSAMYYATAGDTDALFEVLHSTWERRDMFLTSVQTLPIFDPYRADPRYQSLLKQMNLVS
jgi:hypothetical protein